MVEPVPYGISEPLHIFQDDFFSQPNCIVSHAPMPPASRPQPRRRPLPMQTSSGNVVLAPPFGPSLATPSPFKPDARMSATTPLAALKASQPNRLSPVPMPMMPPNVAPPPATDCLDKKQVSRFKPVAQKPSADIALQFMAKDMSHPLIYPAPAPPPFAIAMDSFYPKPNGKRMLLEAAPIKEQRPAKKPKLDEPLPPHDSFPAIVDDGVKPGHSYAILIGMAILRSPERRLTLSQIYKWISDTYSFYKPHDAGWQNSIRHNLSLNKSFIKQERSKDDPGKGNYWAIEPGTEHLFIKDKPARKAISGENVPVMSARPRSSSQLQATPHPPSEPSLPSAPSTASKNSLPALMPSSSQTPPLLSAAPAPEASSEATIPQSDIINAAEKDAEKSADQENGNDADVFSPVPAAALQSSPPIPRHLEPRHHGTPPSANHSSSASKPRTQKRRITNSMDDSGYISSLESSVMRPNQHSKPLASEADRPRIKRGRAEEEIARLRASSYDSPVKGRSLNYLPASSSPLRQSSTTRGSGHGSGQMLPPLTPAAKLKAPPQPPPSASPNTNLRIHRQNISAMTDTGSPFRRVSALIPEGDAVLQMTPRWNVDDILYDLEQRAAPAGSVVEFNVFQDSSYMPIFGISPDRSAANALSPARGNGSPVKRTAKRQRLDRSQSTGALRDISNSSAPPSFNGSTVINPASFLKVPGPGSLPSSGGHPPVSGVPPSKGFDGLNASPSKLFLQSSPVKGTSAAPAPAQAQVLLSVNDENTAPCWSLPMEEMCPSQFLEDGGFGGIDMLAGFAKIGSNNVNSNVPSTRPPKPGQKMPFGRSYSTAF